MNARRGLGLNMAKVLAAGAGVAFACVALAQTGADPGTAPAEVAAKVGASANAAFADHAWCIARASTSARWPVRTDAVEALMAAGTWPHDALDDTPGSNPLPSIAGKAWERIDTPEGVIAGDKIAGGYARVVIRREKAGPVLLRARGHSMVYVNGEPYAGDPYGYGYLIVPMKLREGANELLFAGGRGDITYTIEDVEPGITISLEDATVPDYHEITWTLNGTTVHEPHWVGLTVINTTDRATDPSPGMEHALDAQSADELVSIPQIRPVGVVEAMAARKIPVYFGFVPRDDGEAKREVKASVCVGAENGKSRSPDVWIPFRVPNAGATQILTYISDVDGSVQKYAVVPAAKPDASSDNDLAKPGLILSLHGASVEAMNQANAYEAKKDFMIVAPTNRRPFGFDWEDWGRRDALDVLQTAQRLFSTDESRVYVTGHSMGGHGTWQMGSLFPDKFAAVAPSAGWESFESYAGWMPDLKGNERAGKVAEIFRRAAATCQTALLKENLRDKPVYILHGDADDNVPVDQARTMKELLTGIASPLSYHEQPGAGHWWDDEQGPGAACLDWPGFFEMFRAHRLAPSESVTHVNFTTLDPGVSARRDWITVTQQETVGMPSTIDATHDGTSITVRTSNVAAFEITLAGFEGAVFVDGQELVGSGFVKRSSAGGDPKWAAGFASASERSATRSGPFKRAFDRRAVLVYATQGTPAENAWARAKALFDAQTFGYRGNGGFEVMSDAAYLEALALPAKPDTSSAIWPLNERNVILYGNRDTNALWPLFVSEGAPFDVSRGKVTALTDRGETRVMTGDDLVCVAVLPGPGKTLAGLVAPTGAAGGVAANRLPFFLSGAGFPDYLVVKATMLSDLQGRGTGGVLAAGFFDRAWQIPSFADASSFWDAPEVTPSSEER